MLGHLNWSTLNWDIRTTHRGQTVTRFLKCFFDEAFNQYLGLFFTKYCEVSLLQYMDDLLLVTNNENWLRATRGLLETLAQLGYRVKKKKAQVFPFQVTCFGIWTEEGERLLFQAHMVAVMHILAPTTRRWVGEFLGAVGYHHLWIPEFAEIANPCTLLWLG